MSDSIFFFDVDTDNLDIWISGHMKKLVIEEHTYCSKAEVINDRIYKAVSVVDKELTVKQFVQPTATIGDCDNDAGMCLMADIGIRFGEVREIASALKRSIDYAF